MNDFRNKFLNLENFKEVFIKILPSDNPYSYTRCYKLPHIADCPFCKMGNKPELLKDIIKRNQENES